MKELFIQWGALFVVNLIIIMFHIKAVLRNRKYRADLKRVMSIQYKLHRSSRHTTKEREFYCAVVKGEYDRVVELNRELKAQEVKE